MFDFEEIVLARQLQQLRQQAQQAEKMYASMADNLEDPKLLRKIEQFQHDKHRHVQLAERLIEIVE